MNVTALVERKDQLLWESQEAQATLRLIAQNSPDPYASKLAAYTLDKIRQNERRGLA